MRKKRKSSADQSTYEIDNHHDPRNKPNLAQMNFSWWRRFSDSSILPLRKTKKLVREKTGEITNKRFLGLCFQVQFPKSSHECNYSLVDEVRWSRKDSIDLLGDPKSSDDFLVIHVPVENNRHCLGWSSRLSLQQQILRIKSSAFTFRSFKSMIRQFLCKLYRLWLVVFFAIVLNKIEKISMQLMTIADR